MSEYNKYFKKIYNNGQDEFYNELNQKIKTNKKMFIITANPETFSYAKNEEEISKMLLDENVIIVPDGIGIVKAAQILGIDVKERIPGIEIAQKILEYGNEYQKSLYLFGAKQEVLDSLKEKIVKEYPYINLLGATNGYVENKEKEYQKIIKLKPDLVLVALGIPAQEKLIYKYLNEFKKGIFVGVGGSFDVLSGTKKRAPKIFRKLNIEWLYRIMKEPKRIKRFYNNNIKFILDIEKEKRKMK